MGHGFKYHYFVSLHVHIDSVGCTGMFLEIAIALIVAKLLNILFEKIKQPGVIGEIFAGVLLGPCCIGLFLAGISINLFGSSFMNISLNLGAPEFKQIASIGVIFLLFTIGLDTNIDELKRNKKGIITALFGVIVPFIFGYLIGILFRLDIFMCLAIGVIFVSSSMVLTIRILADLDILGTQIGLTIHTADILNDILVIFLLAFIIGIGHPLTLIVKIILFFVVSLITGYLIVRYTSKMRRTRRTPMVLLTTGIMVCFLFAAFAENMGIAAIIGAFVAGVIIKRTPQAGFITDNLEMIGYAFFIPLYFVWIGASFDFSYFLHTNQILLLLIFIGVFVILGLLGKFIGCSIGARIAGFTKRESVSVGIGMMPRMGIALIIVTTQVSMGIFGDPSSILAQQIKTATLFLVIISSFITPILLKRSMTPPYIDRIKKEKRNLSNT
jgi:Kef-type K+ transport system membrane component KefB